MMSREEYGRAYQYGYDLTVRLLVRRGVAPEIAREAAQAAWVRGWERLAQLRDDRLVVNWINTIALNLYRSRLREPAFEELPELRSAPRLNLAAIDMALILKICAPNDRRLLEQQMSGVTTEEVAQRTGLTRTAIRIRWLRARRAARSRLERRHRSLQRADYVCHREITAFE